MSETPRLTLREASEWSGIPLDALRKRVYRGSIPAEKINGQFTVLEADLAAMVGDHSPARGVGETTGESVPGHGSDTGETVSDPGLTLDYIASLKDEIAFLRRELETRTDELQRRDVLLREALERVPQLPAGNVPQASPAVHHKTEQTGPVFVPRDWRWWPFERPPWRRRKV